MSNMLMRIQLFASALLFAEQRDPDLVFAENGSPST